MKSATIDPTARDQRPAYFLPAILVLLVAGIAAALVAMFARDDAGRSTASQGSGIAATEMRELPSFAGVELAGANNVQIAVGDKQAVVVHADDNLLEHVVTNVRDGMLVITNRGSVKTATPMSIDVTVPSLDTVNLSGTGSVNVDGLRADELTIRVPGGGTLTANGSVERLDAGLDGAADVELGNLVARHVTATLGGVGELRVHATDSLVASVSGAGAIFYEGHPRTVTRSITGTGTIAGE